MEAALAIRERRCACFTSAARIDKTMAKTATMLLNQAAPAFATTRPGTSGCSVYAALRRAYVFLTKAGDRTKKCWRGASAAAQLPGVRSRRVCQPARLPLQPVREPEARVFLRRRAKKRDSCKPLCTVPPESIFLTVDKVDQDERSSSFLCRLYGRTHKGTRSYSAAGYRQPWTDLLPGQLKSGN